MQPASPRQRIKKIAEAQTAIRGKRVQFVARHIADDLADLDLESDELWPALLDCLEEIMDAGPVKAFVTYYLGKKDEVEGELLWSYRWKSQRFNCEMYLKFAILEGASGKQYCQVRLHRHKPY